MRWLLALALVLTCWGQLRAAGPWKPIAAGTAGTIDVVVPAEGSEPPHVSRGMAALLAVTLGPFGGHRIYLGSGAKVPLVYGLTFGGFGVLVVIDLAHILFTKDLSRFQNSDRVFMWTDQQEVH